MDLFSFDFSEESKVTDESIKEEFETLREIFKQNRNGYCLNYNQLSPKMLNHLQYFIDKGWVEKRKNGINIYDDFLLYHTPDEVIETFEGKINDVFKKENVNWLDVINSNCFYDEPIRYKNEGDKIEVMKRKNDILLDHVSDFGLEHFLNTPEVRGSKMNLLSSTWQKKHVMPMIARHVIPIKNHKEMKWFFNYHIFFIGRRDWDDSSGLSAPYPGYIRLMPNMLSIQSLCEAESEEDVSLILSYTGGGFGGKLTEDEEKKSLYPDGWSFDEYLNTLTDEDKEKLWADRKRLEGLHGRDILADNLVFERLQGSVEV